MEFVVMHLEIFSISDLHSQLGYYTSIFNALQLAVLVVFGDVD